MNKEPDNIRDYKPDHYGEETGESKLAEAIDWVFTVVIAMVTVLVISVLAIGFFIGVLVGK
jgi:hypothetical protein